MPWSDQLKSRIVDIKSMALGMALKQANFQHKNEKKIMIFGGHLSKSPAQRLNTKAQLSLSPKLSSKLSPKAQVRLSSVGH